jgi:hypothetical protein
MMLDGKKSTAERIMYDAMNILRERTGGDPAGVLKEASRMCGRPLKSGLVVWVARTTRSRSKFRPAALYAGCAMDHQS